jgi:hypothetical protein
MKLLEAMVWALKGRVTSMAMKTCVFFNLCILDMKCMCLEYKCLWLQQKVEQFVKNQLIIETKGMRNHNNWSYIERDTNWYDYFHHSKNTVAFEE